jgi:hypothetical protein
MFDDHNLIWRGNDLCVGRCCLGVSFPADSVNYRHRSLLQLSRRAATRALVRMGLRAHAKAAAKPAAPAPSANAGEQQPVSS